METTWIPQVHARTRREVIFRACRGGPSPSSSLTCPPTSDVCQTRCCVQRHVIRTGNCLAEATKYCGNISLGSGALATCLSDTIEESEIEAADGGRPHGRCSARPPPAGCLVSDAEDDMHVCWILPADADPVEVSDACREEVYQYKIARSSNINKNIPLGEQAQPP